MKAIIISAFFILNINLNPAFAQCSDAGACQVGYSHGEQGKFHLALSYTNGYSGKEDDVNFHSVQLNGQYELFPGSKVAALIPYNFQSGPGGEVSGIGDLIFSWGQALIENDNSTLTASLGLKLATGDDNKEPLLPQIYQPGLGSTDFILTIDYNYQSFGFGIGYQLAGGRNDKDSVRLKRGDDFIARAHYKFSLSDVSITPQLLFIKRLSESSIIDTGSVQENFINVDNSDQSQLNFLTNIQYDLNENHSLFLEAAIPFLQRENNVDGLKRAYTVAIGMRFNFN